MNYAQAKAAVALLERAAEIAVAEDIDKMHLGLGSRTIKLDVGDHDERDDGVEVTLWRGAYGCPFVIGWDGVLYDYDGEAEIAAIVKRPDRYHPDGWSFSYDTKAEAASA